MKTNLHRQAGGTFLGLILGLIIGLGIAVGVALIISKMPLPFTNKMVSSDRINLQTGELADPNRPMYGKKPQVTVALAANQTKSVVSPSQAVPEESLNRQPTAAERIETARAEAALAGTDEKSVYCLQAGVFHEQGDAESLKAKLALLGFEATVSEWQAETGTLHRVRIGPFIQTETMNRVRGTLSDNGIDVAVVHIGK